MEEIGRTVGRFVVKLTNEKNIRILRFFFFIYAAREIAYYIRQRRACNLMMMLRRLFSIVSFNDYTIEPTALTRLFSNTGIILAGLVFTFPKKNKRRRVA